jgi:hypothetical protein
MFIDNFSVAPFGVYHNCYTPAVDRQNHSLTKYMEICVLYHTVYGTKCSEGLIFLKLILKLLEYGFKEACECSGVYMELKKRKDGLLT